VYNYKIFILSKGFIVDDLTSSEVCQTAQLVLIKCINKVTFIYNRLQFNLRALKLRGNGRFL